MIRASSLFVMVAACGAPAAPATTIANRTPVDTPGGMSVESCRAVVTKHYDNGEKRQTDPITGRTFVVTESDVCGLVIMPIYFERGSATFKAEDVDSFAGTLACMAQTEHTLLAIEITGHTARGEPDELALKRADAVVRYLTACGVPSLGLTAAESPEHQTDERASRVDYRITKRTP